MKAPDVSVVVTNFNYGKYLRRCLRSLINQELDRSRYEVIVVDDHSTDDSLEALEEFSADKGIKVIVNEENLGIGGASRVGVNHSRGKYFVRVDAEARKISLELTIDTASASVMEYFEIFLSRMVMTRNAAGMLGCVFELVANEERLS